jgi:hypothetical protein
MATGLADFIRLGGWGAVVLRSAAAPALSIKDATSSLATLRGRFAANLDRADIANADTLGRVVGDAFNPPLTRDDMADLSADKADTLKAWEARVAVLAAEWGGQPSRFDALRLEVEDELLRAFKALANERRQAFLGITHYVWRSREDERVRHAHAAHDDRVFDWEEPPEGAIPAWPGAAAAGPSPGSSRKSRTSRLRGRNSSTPSGRPRTRASSWPPRTRCASSPSASRPQSAAQIAFLT